MLKPFDKAGHGTVSESPGRNASEPAGSLVRINLRRSSPLFRGEGRMVCRNLADATRSSGGVVGAAR